MRTPEARRYLRDLHAALLGLDAGQGRIARRTARRRAFARLAALRRALGAAYPALAAPARASGLSQDAAARDRRMAKRLRAAGYRPLDETVPAASQAAKLADLAAAGVPVRRAPVQPGLAPANWMPAWADAALIGDLRRLRAGLRSPQARAAMAAEVALAQGDRQ